MQCVILAGGLGTRMERFTATLPKALIPVAGVPFLRHKLQQLADNGIDDVLVSTGHHWEQIDEEVASHTPGGMRVRCEADGPHLLGTAGALRRLSEQGLLDTVFLLTYGDSFLTCDHESVMRAFDVTRFDAAMTVWSVTGSSEQGNCHVDGEYVDSYVKNAPHRNFEWVDYGLSVMTRSAIDSTVPLGSSTDLSTVFGTLAARRRLQAYPVVERFFEIGSEDGLSELETWLSRTQ